jgi:hypothetical protein
MMQVEIFFLTFINIMFKCKQCTNTYKHRGSLTNHLRSHEDPRHECEVCGKKFIRRAYLLKHTTLHHNDLSGRANDSVSDTRSPQTTPEKHTTTMVVLVKIVAHKYNEFLEFLSNCQYVYQDTEVNSSNDLDVQDNNAAPSALTVGMAPPSAHPLMSPLEPLQEECLSIPTARHILDGACSPLHDPGSPGTPFDLGTTEAEREFLSQLERFIEEL